MTVSVLEIESSIEESDAAVVGANPTLSEVGEFRVSPDIRGSLSPVFGDPEGNLRARCHFQFGENARDMRFHRLDGDVQCVSDLLIRLT